jgi:hypothetical protein
MQFINENADSTFDLDFTKNIVIVMIRFYKSYFKVCDIIDSMSYEQYSQSYDLLSEIDKVFEKYRGGFSITNFNPNDSVILSSLILQLNETLSLNDKESHTIQTIQINQKKRKEKVLPPRNQIKGSDWKIYKE